VKANQEKKALTLGGLIHSGYRVCGERRAKGLIRLAAKARLIVFQEPVPLYDFLKER
jgi:hypothetical protein